MFSISIPTSIWASTQDFGMYRKYKKPPLNALPACPARLCLEVIKLVSCSSQLSISFIMLINNKMPTNVGILTCISMINTTSKSLKLRKSFIFQHYSFYEQLKFNDQLS